MISKIKVHRTAKNNIVLEYEGRKVEIIFLDEYMQVHTKHSKSVDYHNGLINVFYNKKK